MRELAQLVLNSPQNKEMRVDIRRMGYTPNVYHPLFQVRLERVEARRWITFELSGTGEDELVRFFVVGRVKDRKFIYIISWGQVRFSIRGTEIIFPDPYL